MDQKNKYKYKYKYMNLRTQTCENFFVLNKRFDKMWFDLMQIKIKIESLRILKEKRKTDAKFFKFLISN